MLAFEVLVNGKQVCLAGAGPKHQVLASIVSWTHRDPNRFGFTVSGLAESDQHFNYDVPQLAVGDEVTIRIVEANQFDEPDETTPKMDKDKT